LGLAASFVTATIGVRRRTAALGPLSKAVNNLRVLVSHYVAVVKLFAGEPALRSLFVATLAVFGIGTVSYHFIEDWSLLDSMYFCTVTLATIGYGDLVPTTDAGRAFTVFYIFMGLGIVAGFLTAIARAPYLAQMQQLARQEGLAPDERPKGT
jgi:hypothetical protein